MYRSLFLLFLCWCCVAEGQAADKGNVKGRNEAMNYCFVVHPQSTLRFTAKSASLEKGKWIKGPTDFTPTSSPKGLLATIDNSLRICVSGKPAPDPEGYQGHVIMENESNDSTIQFNFAHLENGLGVFEEKYDTNQYYLEKKFQDRIAVYTIFPVTK